MKIKEIQDYLVKKEVDGWLMADFHGRNEIAVAFVGISGMITRRSFYWLPAEGTPVALVHAVDKERFANVEGVVRVYSGYKQLESELIDLLWGVQRIAMEYSPLGRLPYVAQVDAGTIELVRETGVEIVSSADIVANFQSKLTPAQVESLNEAAANVMKIKDMAFDLIAESLKAGKQITEWDVARFIMEEFDKHDMDWDHPPCVSVAANAGTPHYEPTAASFSQIEKGQIILIDLWGRARHKNGVFADITQMAFAGTKEEIPEEYIKAFNTVTAARDRAVEFLKENVGKRPVFGYEVDDACRKVIADAGMGDHFTHRTGHSITGAIHGNGPNIDNLETEDRRELQEGHLFSIEPGVYYPHYGVRSEVNALIVKDGVKVTTLPMQTEIRALF